MIHHTAHRRQKEFEDTGEQVGEILRYTPAPRREGRRGGFVNPNGEAIMQKKRPDTERYPTVFVYFL